MIPSFEGLEPGTVVTGPFFSDGSTGVGIVRSRGRALWTRVADSYVAVEVIAGDRISGGYRPESLTAQPRLAEGYP
jgi:hypothetical protein